MLAGRDRADRLHRPLRHPGQVALPHVQALPAQAGLGHLGQVVDQLPEAPAVRGRRPPDQVRQLGIVIPGVSQAFQVRRHQAQRRAQLPADQAGQVVLATLQLLEPGRGVGQRVRVPPQLQLGGHLAGQRAQRLLLFHVQPARLTVHHAERAEREPIGGHQRRPGVEPDAVRSGHRRVVGEPWVRRRVGNHQQIPAEDRVSAEGQVTGRLGEIRAGPGLGPLPIRVDQADHGHRRLTHACGQRDDVVEVLLRWAVQDVERVERGQALDLVVG